MRIPGASSTAIRAVTAGAPQPAQWLGAVDAALYFSTLQQPPTVLAVLSHDAVRLPCAVVLATTATELPLSSIAAPREVRDREPAVVGEGRIGWTGPEGPVTITATTGWSPLRVRAGVPRTAALAELRARLAPCELGLERTRLDTLARTPGAAAVAGLLGCGPGLTPSGDDVLAGYLLAADAFGVPAPQLRRSVADRAPQATSALSAQLLRHAARGEAVREVVDLIAALTRPGDHELPAATTRLLRVGHTSGASLAWGALLAGEHAVGEHQPVLSIPLGGHR